MKNAVKITAVFLVFLAANVFSAESKKGTFGIDMALIFNLQSLVVDVDNYNDGIQPGAGLKMWFGDAFAVRALVHLDHTANSEFEISTTNFGISGALEYHFAPKALSPYAGGLVGVTMEMVTDMDTETGIYFGGMFGVEMNVFKTVSMYAEYDLIAYMEDPVTNITLGVGPNAQVGMLIYF
ncbi:MAG: outer membrane beta-barrel protein [Spirochaetales bacterium]|nr:outer membrane beta-barrel protein [Spirochaetales bacterium]